jgi:hypothetical protein
VLAKRSKPDGRPEATGSAMGTEVSGFQLHERRPTKPRIAPKAVDRFRQRVRELTSRTRGVSTERMAEELVRYLRGCIGYFGKCETPSVLEGLEQGFRRKLWSAIWKQWKRGSVRFAELRRLGLGVDLAAQTAGSAHVHGGWRSLLRSASHSQCSFGRALDSEIDWPPVAQTTERRMRTRRSGGVTGKAPGATIPASAHRNLGTRSGKRPSQPASPPIFQ